MSSYDQFFQARKALLLLDRQMETIPLSYDNIPMIVAWEFLDKFVSVSYVNLPPLEHEAARKELARLHEIGQGRFDR